MDAAEYENDNPLAEEMEKQSKFMVLRKELDELSADLSNSSNASRSDLLDYLRRTIKIMGSTLDILSNP